MTDGKSIKQLTNLSANTKVIRNANVNNPK